MNQPLVIEPTEQQIAVTLNTEYLVVNKAAEDLVKITIRFGAMLAQAEYELDRRGILKNRKYGQGMQGWIAANCPDINYKTAMRWKALAIQAANSLSCNSDSALKLLIGETIDVPAKVIERRDKIFEQSSLRKLTQQLFDFASEDRGEAGRPNGTKSATPTEHYSQLEAARRLWAKPLALIKPSREAFYKAAALLPIDEARETLEELKHLCTALKTRINEK